MGAVGFRFRSVRDFGITAPRMVSARRFFTPYGRRWGSINGGGRRRAAEGPEPRRPPRTVRRESRRKAGSPRTEGRPEGVGKGAGKVRQYGDDNPALGPHVPKRMDGLPVVVHVEQVTPINKKPLKLGQLNPKWRWAKSGGSVVVKGSKVIIRSQHAHVYTTVKGGKPVPYTRVIPAKQVVVDRASKQVSITLDPAKLKALAKKLGVEGRLAITVNVNGNRVVMVAYYDPSTGRIVVPNGQGYVKGDTIVFNVGKYLKGRQIVRFEAQVYGNVGGVKKEIVGLAGYDFGGKKA